MRDYKIIYTKIHTLLFIVLMLFSTAAVLSVSEDYFIVTDSRDTPLSCV